MGLAIMFREVSELAGMCDPLLARGFDESFCDEALRWLVTGEVNHIGEVTQRMTTANLAEYALVDLAHDRLIAAIQQMLVERLVRV